MSFTASSCSSSPKQAQGVRLPSGRFRYLDSLDSRQYAADIGVFIAHGPVRAYVMGEACNLGDKPGGPFKYPTSDEHIAEMQEVVREAVAAGALGFSTNRLGGHRDGQGTCVPGTMGTSYEYTQLAKGAAMGGGGVAQFVSDFSSYDDLPRDPKRGWDQKRAEKRGQQDWESLEFVSREYGLPVLLSMGLPNDAAGARGSIAHNGERAQGMRDRGAPITIQTFARPQALLTSWDCRSNHFQHTATFKELRDSGLPPAELRKSLLEPNVRSAILTEMDDIIGGSGRVSMMAKASWNTNSLKWHYPMGEDFDCKRSSPLFPVPSSSRKPQKKL